MATDIADLYVPCPVCGRPSIPALEAELGRCEHTPEQWAEAAAKQVIAAAQKHIERAALSLPEQEMGSE